MQHGRYQNRQLVPLRLTLPRQPLGQLRLNPFRPNRDPVDLCHRSIPCRKPHGIVCITPSFSPSTYHRGKLMDGKVLEDFYCIILAMADIRKRIGGRGTTYQVRYPSKATKSGYAYKTFLT